MPAYKTVVFVADPDFRHRCFQDCRFAMVCIQYRIIVTIILKMIIIRYTCIIPVITKRIAASRQRTHSRFVIGFKRVHPCFTDVRFLAEFILVDGCYYFLCCPVEFFQTCIDILFQPFNQVGLKKSHMIFNRWFPFRLARWWRNHNDIIKVLKVRKHRIQCQFIL